VKALVVPVVAAALAFPAIAGAEGPSGMSGFVIDAVTRAPLGGVTVVVARDENPPKEKDEVVTDRHGFFTDLALRPGGYVVIVDIRNKLISCIVDDVHEGVVRHMKILVGRSGNDSQCVGPLVRHDTVDPDETASLYRIH